MTPRKFLEEFYFHDSSPIKIDFYNRRMFFIIDFCFWMQNWYRSDIFPENDRLELQFFGVKEFEIGNPNHDLSSGEIMQVDLLDDETMIFKIWDRAPYEYYEIKIRTEDVEPNLSQFLHVKNFAMNTLKSTMILYDEIEFKYRGLMHDFQKEQIDRNSIKISIWRESGICLYDCEVRDNPIYISRIVEDILHSPILIDSKSIIQAQDEIEISWFS